METLISQGAEGKVYRSQLLSQLVIIKERVSKAYRHPELDKKINKQRLLQEARCMAKCKVFGVNCPSIFYIDSKNYRMYIEYIHGITVKSFLWNIPITQNEMQDDSISIDMNISDSSTGNMRTIPPPCGLVICNAVAHEIGRLVGLLHHNRVIHGDLTTSNLMIHSMDDQRSIMVTDNTTEGGGFGIDACSVEDKERKYAVDMYNKINNNNTGTSGSKPFDVVIIDFGLGKMQSTVEDMAVDLYVLERAFLSTHPGYEHFVRCILLSYSQYNTAFGVPVMQKLDQVRMRGRKRDMVG